MQKELGDSESREDRNSVVAKLKAEHAELEQRLAEFDARPFLTPSEQIERKKIQKLKLAKKDRLYRLLNQNVGAPS